MGKRTTDVFDPIVSRWVAAYLGALLGDAPADAGRACNLLVKHRADGMSASEFERRIGLLCEDLPDTNGGHAALKQVVGEAIAELTERLELIEVRERRDRELAVKCAAFDATAAGASRLRYEMSHERVLRASLRDLRTMQKGRPNPEGAATVAPTEPKPPTIGATAAPTEPNTATIGTTAAPTEPKPPTVDSTAAPTEPKPPTVDSTAAPTEPKPGLSPAQPRSTHGEIVEPGEARVNEINAASTGSGIGAISACQ
jgi:hypothetical protein